MITINEVQQMIEKLEAAGEPSMKEEKYLALAKAFKQLTAENVALKESRNNLAEFIHEELDADYQLNMNLETTATDRIVAGIKADGVKEFAESQKEYVRQHRNEMDQVLRAAYAGSAVDAERFAAQLREGADK